MTHTKTPHKHRDIMRAYIDDTSLCAFIKLTPHEKWKVVEQPAFLFQCEYFICLPKHKEAVLTLLNGGDVQITVESHWNEPIELTAKEWCGKWSGFHMNWYMNPYCQSRIKPRKEKRWIGYHECGHTTSMSYPSKNGAMSDTIDHEKWQFIEIEVEV